MKKIFSLIIAAVLFCAYGYADQAVTVNPGGNATQAHFPVYGDNVTEYGHKVQAIYLANQLTGIAVGSEIKALTFYSANQTQDWGQAEFKVSLAKTDFSNFPKVKDNYATASDGSTLTKVYEGKLSVVEGELTINFTTPYTYEGGNLLIQVEISRTSSAAISSFYSAANTDYLIRYAKNANSLDNKQPKVTFVIAGGGDDPVSETCKAPTAVTVEKVTESTATVSWQGEASQYQYCVEFEGDLPDWTAAQLTDQKSVTVSGLYDEQKYYLYVRSYCSETEVSETVRATFKTACARLNVPWIETFTRDASGSGTVGDVAPECWTISSVAPAVTIVAEKQEDGSGNQIPTGQQYLTARGGGATTAQVFALPLFNAQLDTCELAFDYRTSYSGEEYGSLEIGYMTNPADASTFVSLNTFAQTTPSQYQHVVFSLSGVPAGIENIAFRFAGGTNNYGGVAMDNFILAGIGHSDEVDPSQEQLPDASIWELSYCEASFVWYSYNAEYFAIGLFDAEAEALIAGTAVTTSECDRFAYEDGVGFSDGDDYENKYYCSTKWILNVDETGLSKGDAWSNHVINIGTATSPVLGLNPGKYQVQIYALNQTETGYERGELLATIPFELKSKEVSNLNVEVAEDKKSATLSWEAPEFAQGERVYVRVWSGESVAYDNFNSKDRPESPLTVEVEEGKSYTAIVQVVDKNNNPMGAEIQASFTVGTNNYEPTNLHAEVFGGDNVTFTWEAATAADRYVITLFVDGEFYSTLTVSGTSKTTTMPKDGTWSWTVQAFNEGANGNYFEASNAIAGNDFVSKSADVPEDAVELEVTGINAYYIEPNTQWYQEGKNGWFLQFGLNNAGYNFAWFLIYTNKEYAISGVYNLSRENLDGESDGIFMDGSTTPLEGTDSEVRLQFDGFDEVEVASGYSVTQAFYTGSFRLVGTDGKTYVGKFMELMCSSGDFTNYASGNPSNHITLYDEDPDYIPYQDIENIAVPTDKAEKVFHNGQLYIVRPDGAIYNATGAKVK